MSKMDKEKRKLKEIIAELKLKLRGKSSASNPTINAVDTEAEQRPVRQTEAHTHTDRKSVV